MNKINFLIVHTITFQNDCAALTHHMTVYNIIVNGKIEYFYFHEIGTGSMDTIQLRDYLTKIYITQSKHLKSYIKVFNE